MPIPAEPGFSVKKDVMDNMAIVPYLFGVTPPRA
jgi:hypothetical protein